MYLFNFHKKKAKYKYKQMKFQMHGKILWKNSIKMDFKELKIYEKNLKPNLDKIIHKL